MQCNLCGKESSLITAMIESVEMNVCEECARLGTRIQIPKQAVRTERTEIYEPEEYVIEDFHTIIKQARENKKLKQEDAARQLAIKESLLHKIENGSFTPSLRMARKLEKFFGVRLIEEINNGKVRTINNGGENYTIADMMNG